MTTTSPSTLCEVEDMKRTEAEQLFHKNIKLAYHVLHRNYPMFAQDEDMKQEALLGLWQACLTFNPRKAQFSTYAGCCILNQIRMAMRKDAKQPETVSLSTPLGEEGVTLEDMLEDPCPSIDEGLIDLRNYLAGLSEKERQIIQLNIQGLTQHQIGAKMGLSQTWCSRILKKLRQDYLKQEEQE